MTDIEIPLGTRTPKYRFFEMLPLILSLTLVILPIVLSFINPLWAAIFITGYLIMFFVKAIGIAYRTVQGYIALEKAQKVDWQHRLNELERPEASLDRMHDQPENNWHAQIHASALQKIINDPAKYPRPSEVYNAVIIPIYKESIDIIEPTLQALFASHYDFNKLILYIAYEGRGPKDVHELSKTIAKTYAKKCFYATAIMHPENIPGEVVGKGGNITYAGKHLQAFLKQQSIDAENVIVTTLDCDNRPHPAYLAYTTYEYIINEHRNQRAFQPIALYLNNIWDVPAPMRVLATGNSFWTIINSMRPHMLRNFSAHSQGMASLERTELWSVRTIVEDGHQYWRSYFAFDGEYEVVPIYVPIYQDAVLADTYAKTFKAQFLQLRRWAYGASDVAYLADKGFRKVRTVPFWGFIARFWRLLDNHVSWASAPLIITFGAWAPLIINPEANRSIVAHELPQIASQLQFIAIFGLFVMVYLTFKMLPPRPERYKRRRNVFMVMQWLVMPITAICFGAAAAFNAQARLFSGRYLDKFDLTDKVVKK